jgi:hypothetical protein
MAVILADGLIDEAVVPGQPVLPRRVKPHPHHGSFPQRQDPQRFACR